MTSTTERIAKKTPHPLLVFIVLFFCSALINCGMAYKTRANWTPEMLDMDEQEYYVLSSQALDGELEFHARRVLGYPLILALIRMVVGDQVLHIQLVVSFIFSLTSPLTYLLVRRDLGNQKIALLAGAGVMLWPLFAFYGATLYSETLALPMFISTLLTFPGSQTRSYASVRRWLLAGIMLGVCMHVRPMYLLYSPFGALVAYWRGKRRVHGLIAAACLAIGCLLVVLPWSFFMSAREGSFILLSANGGETIAGGLNPELLRMESEGMKEYMTPGGRVATVGPGKWIDSDRTGYLTKEESALPYTQKSKLLTSRALSWIQAHKTEAIYLTYRKLAYMWGINPFWNGPAQTLLGVVPLMGLIAMSIVALIRLRGELRSVSVFWTLPIFVSVVALISWGSWRFREPGDIGLIVLSATLPWISEVKQFLKTD